jgi:hypothetical protein
MRLIFLFAVIISGLALGTSVRAVNAPASNLSPEPFAAGGGFQFVSPFRTQFGFAGHETFTGPRGHMTFDYIVGTTQEIVKVRASVDCMFVIGNYAELAGRIESDSPIPGFQYANLVMRDNGEPGQGPPDQFSPSLVSSKLPPTPPFCFGISDLEDSPITGGNIVVRPHS